MLRESGVEEPCTQARRGVRRASVASASYLHGLASPLLRGRGLEYVDFREYAPGDDHRRIDWRLTARRYGDQGYRLVVREYEEEHVREVTLALALHGSMYYRDKPYTLAYMATLVAGLARRLRDRLRVLTLPQGGAPRPVSPDMAPHLVAERVCRGPLEGDIDLSLSALHSRVKGGLLVLVIDYNVDPGLLGRLYGRLRALGVGVLTVIVYSRPEVVPPPFDGLATLSHVNLGVYGRLGELYRQIRLHVLRVESSVGQGVLVRAARPSLGASSRRLLEAYLDLRAGRLAGRVY